MEIRMVGVVGAGAMGRGIAELVAQRGIEVTLVDTDPAALRTAEEAIDADLRHQIARWAINEAERRAALHRIRFTTDIAALSAVEAVIEAVPDNLSLKREIFAQLDVLCAAAQILASNTSTLSITEIAAATKNPARCIGMHFAGPITLTRVVEVVRGLKTSDATAASATGFVAALDKTAVEVYESPGYTTTRLVVPLLNEAMQILLEGVATVEGIDTAMRLGFDMKAGPLELADRTGLDTLLEMSEQLWRCYGELKYRPSTLLRKLVRAGHVGVKCGEGFYHYDEQGRRLAPAISPGGLPH